MVESAVPTSSAALKRRLRLAGWALVWERAWPALWPIVALLGIFLALALFDIPTRLGASLHWLLLAVLVLAFTAAAYDSARRFSWPNRSAARRRIETASGLDHRPLTAIEDNLASGSDDPGTAALWQAHQRRMEEETRRLKVGAPAGGLTRRDPYALRIALALLLVLGFVDAGPDWSQRILRTLLPGLANNVGAPQVSLDIWVTPPDYTGMPPQFLNVNSTSSVAVPAGSTVLAQVHGGRKPPKLSFDAKTTTDFTPIDEHDFKASATITGGKRLSVTQDGRTLGAWPLLVVPDHAPTIAFAKPPSRSNRMALRLDYKASDDYGVESVKAIIHRSDDPTGEPITLDLPLPGQHLKDAAGTSFSDLTAHLWAGLPVTIQFQASDALGQTGKSDTVRATLPERVFHQPIAKAIIDQRKQLTLKPADKDVIAETLSDLSSRPDRFNDDIVAFMALRSAQARLVLDKDGSSIAPVQGLLWDTALRIEEGRAPADQNALRNAMRNLQDALARNAPDPEIEKLIRQVQEAMNRLMQALAEQMKNMSPEDLKNLPPADPRNTLSMRDLQKMLDRARDMAKTGARDQAKQMLSQLQQMLENLRLARPNPGQNGQQNQMMSQMQQMMQQQQQLLDRSFGQSRQQQSGQNSQGDAQQQQALRQMLQQMMQQLQQQGGQVPQSMSRAERSMQGAEGALQRNQPGQAVGPQSDALSALQDAARAMAQQMMGNNYGDGPGGEPDDNPGLHQANRDPFGRLLDTEQGNGGYDDGGQMRVGKSLNDSALERAKGILDELRRRAGERDRPAIERDYIDRLLKEF